MVAVFRWVNKYFQWLFLSLRYSGTFHSEFGAINRFVPLPPCLFQAMLMFFYCWWGGGTEHKRGQSNERLSWQMCTWPWRCHNAFWMLCVVVEFLCPRPLSLVQSSLPNSPPAISSSYKHLWSITSGTQCKCLGPCHPLGEAWMKFLASPWSSPGHHGYNAMNPDPSPCTLLGSLGWELGP